MPLKRKVTFPKGPASKRAATTVVKPAKPEYKPPRSERWSDVSGSANAEAAYRSVWKDKEKAYSYITLCSALYDESDDEDDDDDDSDGDSESGKESDEEKDEEGEEEDGEDDDSTKRLGPRCGKKHCCCFKLVDPDSNPEHPWVISWAGMRKFRNQFHHVFLRNPDYFSMYTFNDHAAQGSLQVLQNLLVDFDEAAADWREQWAICEGAAHWLRHRASGDFRMYAEIRFISFLPLACPSHQFLSLTLFTLVHPSITS